MSHHDESPHDEARPVTPEPADAAERVEPPVSSSWSTITAPWGTPGNHLTGPIPRIRKRDDGSLTHDEREGEES